MQIANPFTGVIFVPLKGSQVKIFIINGPNLNLLGKRETEIYGNKPFEEHFTTLQKAFSSSQLSYFHSNVEGEIVSALQQAAESSDAVVLNPAGYSHTSVAIADAIAAISIPVVEVHISNIYKREEYRHVSLTGKHCAGIIAGFGMESYALALHWLVAFFGK